MVIPVLFNAMKWQVSTPQGAQSLLSALGSKHDGSIINNLGGLNKYGFGLNILSHRVKIWGHFLNGSKKDELRGLLGGPFC